MVSFAGAFVGPESLEGFQSDEFCSDGRFVPNDIAFSKKKKHEDFNVKLHLKIF